MAKKDYLLSGPAFVAAARARIAPAREMHMLRGLRLGARAIPVAPPSLLVNLREAGRLVAARWRSSKPQHGLSMFKLAEFALLAGCAVLLIATIGLGIDSLSAQGARALPGWAVSLFGAITLLGSSAYCTLLAGAAMVLPAMLASPARLPRVNAGLRILGERGLYVLASLITSGMVSLIVKTLAGRARPQLLDEVGAFAFQGFGVGSQVTSFPSGHTTTAFALAMALSLVMPRWRRTLFSLAIAVGISRVAVGEHYPSDVLAGMCIGSATAYGLACLIARRGLAFRPGTARLIARGQGTIMPAIRALAKAGARR